LAATRQSGLQYRDCGYFGENRQPHPLSRHSRTRGRYARPLAPCFVPCLARSWAGLTGGSAPGGSSLGGGRLLASEAPSTRSRRHDRTRHDPPVPTLSHGSPEHSSPRHDRRSRPGPEDQTGLGEHLGRWTRHSIPRNARASGRPRADLEDPDVPFSIADTAGLPSGASRLVPPHGTIRPVAPPRWSGTRHKNAYHTLGLGKPSRTPRARWPGRHSRKRGADGRTRVARNYQLLPCTGPTADPGYPHGDGGLHPPLQTVALQWTYGRRAYGADDERTLSVHLNPERLPTPRASPDRSRNQLPLSDLE
jgi:hypothetical protein